jgi:hypothetical protein
MSQVSTHPHSSSTVTLSPQTAHTYPSPALTLAELFLLLFTAFFAVDLRGAVFAAVFFLVTVFLAVVFLGAAFLAVAFFTAVFRIAIIHLLSCQSFGLTRISALLQKLYQIL